jgi:hypothetical protein
MSASSRWLPKKIHPGWMKCATPSEGLEFKLHPRVCSDSAAALVPRFKVISDLTRQVWLWAGKQAIRSTLQFNH